MNHLRTLVLGCLACLLLAAQAGPALAQGPARPALDPDRALSQYHLDQWTNETGLPMNSVMAVAQTPDGYLWVGTEEGLARFDGVRFVTFDHSNTQGFEGGHVLALLVDRAGTLWIGTNGGGLVAYKDGRFRTYRMKDGLPSDAVGALYEDARGTLWIGTLDGLAGFRNGRFTRLGREQGFADSYVLSLSGDQSGALWIGTRSGLKRLRDGRVTAAEGFPQGAYWSVHADRQGSVWAGTDDALFQLGPKGLVRYTQADGLPGDHVWSLHEDARGTIWAGTDAGLARIAEGRLSTGAGLGEAAASAVTTLFSDREGSLWFGTEGEGLGRLKSLKFSTYTRREGLPDDQTWVVYEDRLGRIWTGTDSGLSRYEDGRFTTYTTADGLSSPYVNALWEDADGVLWVGTNGGGLNRFDGTRFTHLTTADGLPDDNVLAVYPDRRGRLWIGTSAGLAFLEAGKISRVSGKGSPGQMVFSIQEDREGTVWFGTRTGLFAWRDGRFTAFTRKNGLPSDYVFSIYADPGGAVWVGTSGGGLARYSKGRFSSFGAEEGLPSETIFQVLDDGRGSLWLTSNIGVARVAKGGLDSVAAGLKPTVHAELYDRNDGLRNREFNGGGQPAGWRARDGRLWFPTVAGLASILPARLSSNAVAPRIVIEGLISSGEAVPVAASVALPPSHGDLEIQYTSTSLLVPEEVTFQYMLEGFDEGWVDAGARRTAYYTNVPPGRYTFRVRARNNDGVWSEQPATLNLHLRPFFYQTSLFLAGCLLLLGLTAFGTYRLRIRRLQARERELLDVVEDRTRSLREEKERAERALRASEDAHRNATRQEEIAVRSKSVIEAQAEQLREMDRIKTRFFNNISHEFRTPLTLTIGPLENALTGMYGPVEEPLRSQLDLTLSNARRLLRLINQLLDLARLESGSIGMQARPGNLVPFVEGVLVSFTAFAEERELTLEFSAEQEEQVVFFDPAHLEKVFFNLFSNAVKFTPPGGRIAVAVAGGTDAASGRQFAEIRVRDTGPGIPEEEQGRIFDRFHQVRGAVSTIQQGTGIGLSLARELVDLHGGTLTVKSAPGEGATFIVRLPEGREHLKDEQVALEGPTAEVMPSRSALVEMVAVEGGPPESQGALTFTQPAGAKTVLIVDDNREVREYVRSIVAGAYRIVEAKDGVEGLRVAEAERPDLILSDVMMPVMDGYTLCRHVKESPRLRHIPVVLLTAKASDDQKAEGLELGADDYMAKPFNGRELLARIGNQLRLREQERELMEMNEHLESKVQAQLEVILAERRAYEERLLTEKERAEESARLKDAILTNMSHEIRTPITAILGSAQILQEEVQGEQQEFVAYIEQNGRRLLNTITSILDLAKVEASGERVQFAPLDLVAVARENAGSVDADAKKKGLTVSVEAVPPEIIVPADRSALDRVLQNLLGNAVKFTEAGGVSVRVAVEGGSALVEVGDTGVGIEEAFLPHLFDAFTQESVGLQRAFEGAGLGLTLSRRLIEAMGGEIRVRSRKDEGSVFTVTLPLYAGDGAGGAGAVGRAPEYSPSGDGAGAPGLDVSLSR